MPTLVISIDGAVIKEVQLTKEHTTLGRRPYNDIVIENLAVSGEHAVITMDDGVVSIEDLRSTNGTHVNGKIVRTQVLSHGDLLDIGRYKIRFLNEAPPPTKPPAMAKARPLVHISEATDGDHAKLSSPSGFGELSGFAATQQGRTSILPSERHAFVHMLTGSLAGKEVALYKIVTTLGKPGVAVASITRKPHGFVLTQIEGNPAEVKLNGQPLGPMAVPLLDGDVVELAGSSLRFVVE